MKKNGCKITVAALLATILLTGCGGSVKEETLTTESGISMVKIENLDTEHVDTEDLSTENSEESILEEAESSTDKSSANNKQNSNKANLSAQNNTIGTKTNTSNTGSLNTEIIVTTTSDTSSQLVTDVINQIITSGMSDLEKAKAIHDWMVMNIDYDYQNYINNTIPTTSWHVDGVLTTKYAICDGYAKTFKALCEAAGLECDHVVGDTTQGAHAWNQVKIDEIWYNVDVTWDDPANRAFDDHSANRYTYFLISDAQMYKDHTAANAQHTCSSSLTEQVMQMYCPWRDYNYIKNADELPPVVAAYVNANTAEMRFKIDPNVYTATELSNMVSDLVAQCNVVNNYRKVGIFSNTDDWGIKTYIIKFELKDGVFTKYTPMTNEDELKAEILRIKTLPDYTSTEHSIYLTEDLLNQTNYFETLGKWLYFDAGLVLDCHTYCKQYEGMYEAPVMLRPVTAEDNFIENAMNDAEVEAIIQDRLARGITSFTVRYYYNPNLTENESFSHAVYEMGEIWTQSYGLAVNGSYQTSDSCFLYFQLQK